MRNQTRKTLPTLLSLSSAFPRNAYSQQELYETLAKDLYRDIPQLERIIRRVRVKNRYLALDPREALARDNVLGVGERMALYERAVMEVGGRSVEGALRTQDRERIGSFIMASSTGYVAPTPDVLLARQFHLSPTMRHTFVGNMACNASLNVLNVALDSLMARPDENVLINCTEFSSLHVRDEASREQLVVHALFGDGSASAVLGQAEEGAGPQFLGTHSMQFREAHDLMTWKLLDNGFRMTLSSTVPYLIRDQIEPFMEALVTPAGLRVGDIKHWAIHPGGPKIVEVIGEKFGLSDSQLRSTWHVLEEYGNCSSPTVLFVLEEMLAKDKPQQGEYGVMLGFGPGLTMEGALVRF
ncbi:type III polyketide synthase [Stigmatella hybrida]|uniref:type III polyketide synthase n=1 Tax=Stigmatella hybrida TaxID=394097 RepID=UPI001CDA9DCB|nr:type III polyketide synthase [Stigmatella hybrida]